MDEINIQKIESPEIVYQQDRAAIDTQIATAKQFPRSIKKAVNNAITVVTMDKEIASTCTYALPRSGKSITGPSVHLAKIIAQQWGNMRVEAKVIDISEKQVTSQAIAFDLENNLAIKVEVKRSIWGKRGRFNDDMITVTGNAANAIALRNAVFAVVPKGVVDKVHKASKEVITGDISEESKLIAKRTELVNALKETYEVTEEEILTAIGKASIDHIGRDEIVTLIAVGQAIKDGDTTVDQAFRPNKFKDIKKTSEEKEEDRVRNWIKAKTSKKDLAMVNDYVHSLDENHELRTLYENKLKSLGIKNE